jgi:tripartite-type tricarboxylate transporter receptor subunit TctC
MKIYRKLFALASAVLFTGVVAAQAFPSKPIKIIIPFAAGGTADPIARILADVIEKKTGAKFIIEAKPGAGGNIGNQFVANADKDGYTILLGANNNYVVNQFLFPRGSVDVAKQFDLISILVDQPQVIYVRSDFPAKSFKELVAYVKDKPGMLNYASPGPGSAPHLAGEVLSDEYGLSMVHIPFKGGAPAVTALIAGDVQLYMASLSVGKAFVTSGKLRALGTTSAVRMSAMPDLVTTKELGYPNYNVINWWALAAPKGTPAANLQWIHKEFTEALKAPGVANRLEELGFVMNGSTPAQFEQRFQTESKSYETLIKKRKISPE